MDRMSNDIEALREQATRQYWAMVGAKICPHCGKKAEFVEHACCMYAEPCGHRIAARPRRKDNDDN